MKERSAFIVHRSASVVQRSEEALPPAYAREDFLAARLRVARVLPYQLSRAPFVSAARPSTRWPGCEAAGGSARLIDPDLHRMVGWLLHQEWPGNRARQPGTDTQGALSLPGVEVGGEDAVATRRSRGRGNEVSGG